MKKLQQEDSTSEDGLVDLATTLQKEMYMATGIRMEIERAIREE